MANTTVNDRWTQPRIDQLKALWASGATAPQIANALGDGFTKNAVLGKAHKLKLPGRANLGNGITKAQFDASRPVHRQPSAPIIENFDMEDGEGVDVTHLVGILDLERHHCRWPMAGDGSATMFCGERSRHGPYCPRHASRAGIGYGRGPRP